ncbi:hypothetical protein ABKV19_024732 [Rosa sericea]
MSNSPFTGKIYVSKKSRKGRKRRKLSEKETENKLSGEHDTVQKETDISNGEQATDMSVTEKRSLDTSSNGKQDVSIPGQPDEGDSSGDEQVAATAEVDFKLSLTIFYDILAEQNSSPCNDENIVGFLKSLVRKMLKKMKQPLLFVEILFWKTRKECHYINAEYLLHELGQLRNESRNSGDTIENGGMGRSMDQGWTGRNLADALGEDEADVVLNFGHNNNEENLGKVEGDATSTSDNEIDGKEDYDNGGQSMKTETGRGPLKKKRLVIGEELEMTIKDLYENNSRTTTIVVTLLLKLLILMGKFHQLKFPTSLSSLDSKLHEGKDCAMHRNLFLLGLVKLMEMERKQLLLIMNQKLGLCTQKKRVRGLSEEQEARIRSLYDQFKDHKSCNHMIANAMDADDQLTAPQVTRKLKQLGLYIPWKKRSGANMLMRDQDLNDSNNANASDDETLLSLMNRGKKDNIRISEVPEQITGREVAEDESDDEMLSSVLKKAKGSLSKLKGQNLTAISIQGTARGNALENKVEEAVVSSGRDVNEQSSGSGHAEIHDADTFNHASPIGTAQAEVTSTGSGNLLDATPVKNVEDLQHQKIGIDMEDSGDEATHSALTQGGASRRKMRMMVLEDEDDD